jgi:outer membrane scaffolding protein for murein synthesis (MipA/OmpV family)
MSDEQEGGGTSVKSILIGLLSTITLGVGGYITNKLTGGEEEEKTEVAAPAPVININNSNQQTQQQTAGKTIIIDKSKNDKSKEAPAIKEVKPKKTETEQRKEEGLDW